MDEIMKKKIIQINTLRLEAPQKKIIIFRIHLPHLKIPAKNVLQWILLRKCCTAAIVLLQCYACVLAESFLSSSVFLFFSLFFTSRRRRVESLAASLAV